MTLLRSPIDNATFNKKHSNTLLEYEVGTNCQHQITLQYYVTIEATGVFAGKIVGRTKSSGQGFGIQTTIVITSQSEVYIKYVCMFRRLVPFLG